MHVLILAQYFPPDIGGSSTRAYNVARGLVLNGIETTVVTAFPHYPHGDIPSEYQGKPFQIEKISGINVIRTYMVPLESKGLAHRVVTFITFILSSLIGLLLTENADAVWVANPDIFGIIPGLLYKWKYGCPLVFNVDDLSIEDVNNLDIMTEKSIIFKLAKGMSRFLYQRIDAVTPISPGYFEGIAKFGIPRSKMHLVRVGVDLATFKEPKEKPKNCFTIAYSGSFSIAYDFNQVIKAAKLMHQHKDIQFIIQGKGELGPRIKQSVHEHGLSNVSIRDEILTRNEVSEFLGNADVLILPLKDFGVPYPGISSKLYEYQALGKPIVCCTEGQSSKYVKKTNSGIIVKPGDHQALAEAVKYLYDHPDKADSLGTSGRKYVEKHVGIENIGLRMKKVIEYSIQRR
ncbi:MAG: glycosyltransferase family 4 protein [Candidatus Bathyarchaeota archaeon]|nr:glycosyltransferase family 4 protein [Candidatus Bathyarchaeota archaeon]